MLNNFETKLENLLNNGNEFNEKEKSFIQDCLKINAISRLSCEQLIKNIFSIDSSTISILWANSLNGT